MPEAPDFSGRTILAVFAHPDDESLACGGTLARLADAGARVVAALRLARRERIGERPCARRGRRSRRACASHELHEAARVLGIAEVLDPAIIPTAICAGRTCRSSTPRSCLAIERYQPDGVITFAEDGLYWHLDHIGVHERTYTAVKSLGAGAPPLYYVTMPHGSDAGDRRRGGRERVEARGESLRHRARRVRRPRQAADVRRRRPRLGAAQARRAPLPPHADRAGQSAPASDRGTGAALLGVEQFRRSPLDAGWTSVIEQLGERVTT